MKKVLLLMIIAILAINISTAEEQNWNQKTGKMFKEQKFKFDEPKPILRYKDFMKQRAYPYNEIPENARLNAIRHSNRIVHKNNSQALMLAQQPEWSSVGPFQIGGRIKSVVIHPDNDNIVFIGAAAGGIWKSTDAGASWTPIFDFQNAISFGSLAIDPNQPNIMYAGTGEAVLGGGNIYLGSGMYKSLDGGDTWGVIGLTQVGAFSKVFVHPKNSNLIVAGGVIRGQGFWKSTDAGLTWERKLIGNVTDVSINPDNENEYVIGVSGAGILYSADGGENWVERNNGLESGIGRVSVQFAPSDPNILYTLMEINKIGTIFKSTNKGANWFKVYQGASAFFNDQGFYNNYITVHPTNADIVLAGGIDIWRTENGGSTWSNRTLGYQGGHVHVDQHHATFSQRSPHIVYAGNDGGMYRSQNSGIDWVEINNGLEVTQFYAMGIDHTKPNRNYGGTQDNGTVGNYTSEVNWGFVAGGDGFDCFVDVDNSNIVYGEYYYGNMFKRDVTTNFITSITSGIPSADQGLWHSPFVKDYNFGSVFYHGRGAVYASYDKGGNWTALTSRRSERFTAIEPSKVDPEIIWAGCTNGDVIVSNDAGFTWQIVSENVLPNRYVKDIETSYLDPNTCYVAYSGYGESHVYKTTNLGATWQDISVSLPDVPCNALAIHPENENVIFVGTDIGVFATYDGGYHWFPFGRNMPRSPVTDLEFHQNRSVVQQVRLRAATHGRSIWEVDIPTQIITTPEITSPAGGEIYPSGTQQIISFFGFDLPVKIEYLPVDGEDWITIHNEFDGFVYQWKIPHIETIRGKVRVTSLSNANQMLLSNTFTVQLLSKGMVMSFRGVGHTAYGIAYDGQNGLWSTSFNSSKLYKLNATTLLREKEFVLPGDSLFTDLTIDRENGIIYIHKLTSTSNAGGTIIVADTNGNIIGQFPSPATSYPIGLELLNGNLLIGDRDKRNIYNKLHFLLVNPQTGEVVEEYDNPYQKRYGPRGICYDGSRYLYQVCTDFPASGALTEAVLVKFDKDNISTEVDRLPLESFNGIINARGVAYDPRDKTFWISDFGGNIYKIAGYETVLSVEDDFISISQTNCDVKLYPNPVNDFATLSFMLNDNEGMLKIDLIDNLGNFVNTLYYARLNKFESDFIQINSNDLASGQYNLVFTLDNKQLKTKKFIVVK